MKDAWQIRLIFNYYATDNFPQIMLGKISTTKDFSLNHNLPRRVNSLCCNTCTWHILIFIIRIMELKLYKKLNVLKVCKLFSKLPHQLSDYIGFSPSSYKNFCVICSLIKIAFIAWQMLSCAFLFIVNYFYWYFYEE